MKIKLKNDCRLECWSGRTDVLIPFKKGDEFEVEEFDEKDFVSESEEYGTIYIEKDLTE